MTLGNQPTDNLPPTGKRGETEITINHIAALLSLLSEDEGFRLVRLVEFYKEFPHG